MEALAIIFSFVGVIVGGFIGYFLKQSEYDRQRRDELVDRKTDRRSKFRASKIEEVQSYINNCMDMTRSLILFETMATEHKVTDMSIGDFDKIDERMSSATKSFGSIIALDDSVLTYVNTGLIETLKNEVLNAMDLVEMIGNKQKLDEITILKRISECDSNLRSLLVIMQRRLNELAQTVE